MGRPDARRPRTIPRDQRPRSVEWRGLAEWGADLLLREARAEPDPGRWAESRGRVLAAARAALAGPRSVDAFRAVLQALEEGRVEGLDAAAAVTRALLDLRHPGWCETITAHEVLAVVERRLKERRPASPR